MSDVLVSEGSAAEQELVVDHDRPAPPTRMPVGPQSQLATLQSQLEWCDQTLRRAIFDTAQAMRDPELSDAQRWSAVHGLRNLAWKVTREILPLMHKVPASLHGSEAFSGCQRIAHQLRRSAERALGNNANYTVDLLNAGALQGRTW